MKKAYIMLAAVFLFLSVQVNAATAVSIEKNSTVEALTHNMENGTDLNNWEGMTKKDKRAFRKGLRKKLKQAIKNKESRVGDGETLLLVIIAILLPPLAMALYDGISKRFWISLLLTLLFYLPGLIYTLVVILG